MEIMFPRRFLPAGFISLLMLALAMAPARGQQRDDTQKIPPEPPSWPAPRGDNQRSGFTRQNLGQNLERKWFRSFVTERISPRVEAVVVDRTCFVPTLAGNVYALDIRNGKTEWSYRAPGRIGHSVAFRRIGPDWRKREGRIVLATDDAWNAGHIVCLNARNGQEVWRYQAEAGFWTAPLVEGNVVYAGDRSGVLHAVNIETGQGAWTFATGGMILAPASSSRNGRWIVVASEDMHVYAIDADTGKEAWVSEKLPGLSLRDYAPVICDEKVIVRTNPARGFHETLLAHRGVLNDIQRNLPLGQDDVIITNTQNQYILGHTTQRENLENEKIGEWLDAHPHDRTFHVLNLKDGTAPFHPPVLYTAGMHNPPTPPSFQPGQKLLYTLLPTALSPYASGVSALPVGVGKVNTHNGYVHNLGHRMGDKLPGYFAGMTMIADETTSLSLMGRALAFTHQGAVGLMDIRRRQARLVAGARDSYGGLFGPGVTEDGWAGSSQLVQRGYVQNAVNEWHGPARSNVSVAEGRMVWVVGGCVVCLGRRDRQDEPDSRQLPFTWPDMPRINGGNITSPMGVYDTTLPVKPLDDDDIDVLIMNPRASKASRTPQAMALRERLDVAVSDLVKGHPYQPWIVVLGISGPQQYFWRTAETMEAVALALPHLSAETRQAAVAFLDELWQAGVPLTATHYGRKGQRREAYTLHPSTLEDPAVAPNSAYTARASDLYAIWAYAYHADRWDAVKDAEQAIKSAFIQSFRRPMEFDPARPGPRQAEYLNGIIAGAIAYARIQDHLGNDTLAEQARAAVARLLTQRVHLERANPQLQSPRAHHAEFYRYNRMSPELAAALGTYARDALAENLRDLDAELPGWYHAWPTRWIGGENYTTPPTVADGLFMTLAEALDPPTEQLLARLDQPWCQADLYYIRKLTAVLRGLDDVRLRDDHTALRERPTPRD